MKHLRHSLVVGALTLVFTVSAFAGEMDTMRTATSAGEMGTMTASTGRAPNRARAVNPVIEIALRIAQSALSLF